MSWLSRPDKDGFWLWRWKSGRDPRIGVIEVRSSELRELSGTQGDAVIWQDLDTWHLPKLEYCFVGEG